ncbi:pseudouridine synthase [Uliginosibacterium sp. TH139]|uniref:pseudouridine synthase n=1 Tax=Uliginosibacterium sp. TH139 TaxID=2067453 RepID=UPI000C7C8FBD|nr:pseudouridine synthase [Uliginosibacterium sp. TH139]PLK49904.1 hypothetical protein C0V76_05670 [Uliginosibacterium sp. TH139]
MAEDSKRSKLSLPAKTGDAPTSERRTRAPLRGSSKPRAPKPATFRPREESSERAPREGRGSDERRPYADRNERGDRPRRDGERPARPAGDRPQRDGRSFDERRPAYSREGERPRRDDSRPSRPAFGERTPRPSGPRREEDRTGFNGRLPREEFRGGAGRGFDERRPQGDRPPRREGERPSFGERPARGFGERGARPEGRDERRPAYSREGERAPQGDRPQRSFRDDGGDRRFGSAAKPRTEGEHGSRRPAFEGGNERRPAYPRDGERPAFSPDQERRPYAERAPREGRSFGERDGHREERRPAFREGDRPARPAFRDGERSRPDNRAADERRPYAERPARDGERAARPAFRDGAQARPEGRSFGSERPRRDEAPRTYGERPRRDLDRDGPAPAPKFGDDQMPAAPRGTSFGRSRAETAPEPAPERYHRPVPPERFANAPAAAPVDQPGAVRLSKLMSELGLCSRREADDYIERGWVKVDGEVIAELGAKVLPTQHIELNAVAEEMQLRRITVLINKPIGYVSGQAEDGYEPAAVLITPENHWAEDPTRRRFESRIIRKLAPAGRLDIDSTGLLVLTQDGRVAKQLIGETSEVEKEYLVRVEGELSAEGMRLLHHGLELDGVELQPAKVSWQNEDQLRFVLQEGRKRQIRRMCELVGLKVVGLKRIRIGSIPLGKLPVGQWRYLGEHEKF